MTELERVARAIALDYFNQHFGPKKDAVTFRVNQCWQYFVENAYRALDASKQSELAYFWLGGAGE